FVFS
ncbi:UBN2 domain-containing protein, partial [Cephalotus follicularis]